MDQIPVTFEHMGKTVKGQLGKVQGAGDTEVWHLHDNKNYYLGRLRRLNAQWVFDPTPKTESLVEMAQYFGDVVTAWYQ
jgi:hypothetical protein